MNRVAIFAHFDAQNEIKEDVIYYLQELKKCCKSIIFVSDCNVLESELKKLDGLTSYNMTKHHGEYDWGSYKIGYLYLLENNLLDDTEELLFCNDSVYGPIFPLEEYFNIFSAQAMDFGGLYKNMTGVNGVGYRPHIQSWFIIFKKKVFLSDKFKQFISNIKKLENKEDIISLYEIGCTETLEKTFSCGFLYSHNRYSAMYTSPLALVANGFPFLKKYVVQNSAAGYILYLYNKQLYKLVSKVEKARNKKFNVLDRLKYLYRTIRMFLLFFSKEFVFNFDKNKLFNKIFIGNKNDAI